MPELFEVFSVELHSAEGARIEDGDATGTILDDDSQPHMATLKIDIRGSGDGSITATPVAHADGARRLPDVDLVLPKKATCSADCSLSYVVGTVVSLAATTGEDSVFMGWDPDGMVEDLSSSCEGTGSCTVVVAGEKDVAAKFLALYELTIVKLGGSGGARITTLDGLIDCTFYGKDDEPVNESGELVHVSGTCSAKYLDGTQVNIHVELRDPHDYVGPFHGACTVHAKDCTATMDADKELQVIIGRGSAESPDGLHAGQPDGGVAPTNW